MTEAKTGLYAALAKVQAELPAVAKNQTGEIKGTTKDGKPYSYDYKYADLDAVSDAIIPLLGKHGLSFTAEPGSDDQDRLVLKYALLHESGEERPGQFPLWLLLPPRFTAQTVGGLITYGRRYCLCAVTGVAPGGDSDAAGIGETTMDKPRGRSQDWRHPPPRPADQLPRNQDGSLRRSEITDQELDAAGVMTSAQQKEHTALRKGAVTGKTGGAVKRVNAPAPEDEWTTPAETDQKWYAEVEAEIRKFTSDDYSRVLWRRVNEKTEAGGCTREDGEKLQKLIRARHQALAVERKAEPEPADA
jgi:ERF superfamily